MNHKDLDHLEHMSKNDIIDFILNKAVNSKRELKKRVMVQTQMSQFVNNYSQYLGSQPKGSSSQSRESEELEAKQKQIDVLNAEKKKIETQLNEVKGPIKDASAEKFKAQQEMTEKRVKRNYKFFEKKSDELPVKLMETFVASSEAQSRSCGGEQRTSDCGRCSTGAVGLDSFERRARLPRSSRTRRCRRCVVLRRATRRTERCLR